MSAVLRVVGGALKEAIYPRRCAGCGARGAWVCDLCLDSLDIFSDPLCARCGVPLTVAGCRCAGLPSEIAVARAVGPFAGWLRSSVIALKYQDERDRASHLGALLAGAAPALPNPVLIPVPLHPARLRHRGYNQSALVAMHAARVLGWPCVDAVQRVRETKSQVGLGAAERSANMIGAFALNAPGGGLDLRALTPVLVDDVLTTGSTLAGAAQPLLAAGASSVVALTIAREL